MTDTLDGGIRQSLFDEAPKFILRPDQVDLNEKIDRAIAEMLYPLMVMAPTGYGKTVVFGARCYRAVSSRKRIAVIVPYVTLVDQTIERMEQSGIHPDDIGVMQSSHERTNPNAPLQICTPQTLARRGVGEFDEIVIDEGHRFFDVPYKELLTNPKIPIISFSATPWSKGLGKYYKHLIIGATIADLIPPEKDEDRIPGKAYPLCRFKTFAAPSPDLSKITVKRTGDYDEEQLSDAMSNLTADAVSTWEERAKGLPTLVFCVDRAHAHALTEKFKAAGHAFEYQDSYVKPWERRLIRERFISGETVGICSVGTMVAGVDLDVRCISMCRPTKSEILWVQMLGRGLRAAPGKDHLIVLDHSQNTMDLGYVTEIFHGKLHDGKRDEASEKKPPLPKPCSRCSYIKPLKVHKCPNCGHEPEIPAGAVHAPGVLLELDMNKGVKDISRWEKAEFYAQLRWIQAERGYKSGWAAHKYKERFQSFPPWDWNNQDTMPPAPATLSWVRSRQIAFSKSRKAA